MKKIILGFCLLILNSTNTYSMQKNEYKIINKSGYILKLECGDFKLKIKKNDPLILTSQQASILKKISTSGACDISGITVYAYWRDSDVRSSKEGAIDRKTFEYPGEYVISYENGFWGLWVDFKQYLPNGNTEKGKWRGYLEKTEL